MSFYFYEINKVTFSKKKLYEKNEDVQENLRIF